MTKIADIRDMSRKPDISYAGNYYDDCDGDKDGTCDENKFENIVC